MAQQTSSVEPQYVLSLTRGAPDRTAKKSEARESHAETRGTDGGLRKGEMDLWQLRGSGCCERRTRSCHSLAERKPAVW